MKFVILTEEEYDGFARKHPCRNFLNSKIAFDMKEVYNWQHTFVGVKDNNTIICATGLVFVPMMKKYFYAYAQRGLLIDYENKALLQYFTQELSKYLKAKQVVYLKIDPYIAYKEHDIDGELVTNGFDHSYVVNNLEACGYQHQGFTKSFSDYSQVRWMFVLDLDGKTEEQLLAEMDHQTRWSVNKTVKLDVKVRELTYEEIPLFQGMMEYASSTRNFTNHSLEYWQNQMKYFGTDGAKILMAYLDMKDFRKRIQEDLAKETKAMEEIDTVLADTPNSKKFTKKKRAQQEALDLLAKREKEADELEAKYGDTVPMAAGYFTFYEDEIVYVYSGAYDEFRKYNAPYAVQWHVLRYALAHGYKRYNFYGMSGIFDESAVDYGVYMFKKGFNGVVEELVGDFLLPVDKLKFKLYQGLEKMRK